MSTYTKMSRRDFVRDFVSDFVSDLVLDIIHRNIWMKFQKYSMENEAYSVCTRFFLDYIYWPSFLPEVAHIWTLAKKKKHSDKLLWTVLKNEAPIVYTRFFNYLI